MTTEQQRAMDALYAIDNVVTVKITMPPADWESVRNERPKGGVCNFDFTDGSRYTWRTATTVEISGTHFPPTTTFTGVGIKKKSFCGSISSTKPCLHLDFGKDNKPNRPLVEGLIGTRYLTLNNSVQDASYVRQTLGYKLFELAGLPHSRCNYIRVFVNGTPVGQGLPGVNSPGVFISAEPIMPRYIERNFVHRKGNLYEIEHNDDLTPQRLNFVGVESLSEFTDRADLKLAINHIKSHGVAGAAEVLDLDQFIKLYAMEFFLKHWDGYSRNTNNTYLYNDVEAVPSPTISDVNFRMIPWGLDQILQAPRHFVLGTQGLLGRLIRDDATRRKQLMDQIRTYRETVFGREVQTDTLIPMLDDMQARLKGLGVPNLDAELGVVRKQLRLATSAGYLCAGLPTTGGAYIRDDVTITGMRTGTEKVPVDVPDAAGRELIHQPRTTPVDDVDLWTFGDLGSGKSVIDKANGLRLHASTTLKTAQGHTMVYASPGDNREHAEEFTVTPLDSPDPFTHSGYFELRSVRTGLKLRFGSDGTPAGKKRVHQDPQGSRLFFS